MVSQSTRSATWHRPLATAAVATAGHGASPAGLSLPEARAAGLATTVAHAMVKHTVYLGSYTSGKGPNPQVRHVHSAWLSCTP